MYTTVVLKVYVHKAEHIYYGGPQGEAEASITVPPGTDLSVIDLNALASAYTTLAKTDLEKQQAESGEKSG